MVARLLNALALLVLLTTVTTGLAFWFAAPLHLRGGSDSVIHRLSQTPAEERQEAESDRRAFRITLGVGLGLGAALWVAAVRPRKAGG